MEHTAPGKLVEAAVAERGAGAAGLTALRSCAPRVDSAQAGDGAEGARWKAFTPGHGWVWGEKNKILASTCYVPGGKVSCSAHTTLF